jgi:predicted transcriptional regulator
MGWGLRLVDTEVNWSSRSVDVMVIDPSGDLEDVAALGLTLAQGKQLVAMVQQEIVTVQSRDHVVRRPLCRSCGTACQIKDYRPHQIATLFSQVTLRLPRFRCAGCGRAEAGHGWPAHCRSTLELDQVRAQFSACMPYWVAAGVLEYLLPVEAGITHKTLRGCTLRLGEEVWDAAPVQPAVPIRKSVTAEYIVCLEDGRKLKMLKRHLRSTYGMTPDEYRAKWNLPADYPMVAPAYAEKRSEFAKAIGLGRSRSEPEPEPEAVPARRGRPRAA